MAPYSNDDDFSHAFEQAEQFLIAQGADFILLQCGADSIQGDPITTLAYSEQAHAYATQRLCKIANKICEGRLLAMGGGGYNHDNIAKTWTAVVSEMAFS